MTRLRIMPLVLGLWPLIVFSQQGPGSAQVGSPSVPPWQTASPWPDRIIVTIENDPKTSFAVTWRTDTSATAAHAEIVRAEAHSRFDSGATSVAARSTTQELTEKKIGDQTYPLRWNAGLPRTMYHTASFRNLEPDTLYAYRVMGAEGHWSEWFQTRTAAAQPAPIRFLYLGDAQDGILSHWARTIRAAYAKAPDARFVIHAGDLVNLGGRDFEWAEWFRSVSFIHGMIPAVPVPGNHEYFEGIMTPARQPIIGLTSLWRPQFALPQYEELPEAVQETVYALDYGDLIVIALNTMADEHFEAQARWMDRVLSESKARWRIVTMHHPIFELLDRPTVGFPETGAERRALFLPLLRKHGVDLALQGHDHSYGRGALVASGKSTRLTRQQAVNTVFVSSSSGAKMYDIKDGAWADYAGEGAVLQRRAENTQFFQVISIDGDELVYEAYTATGDRYDAFRLNKQKDKPNRLTELPVDLEERAFANTPPYQNDRWDQIPEKPAAAGD